MEADLLFAGLLRDILDKGSEITTRNSVTKRRRNQSVTFHSTPLVSVRKTAWKLALREMEWFLSGSSNINDLHPSVRHWWSPWADESGVIANNYSKQFRAFSSGTEAFTGGEASVSVSTVDQISYALGAVRSHPFSRRNVITTWNTADMVDEKTPITNCHGTVIQSFVEPDNSLHMTMYQRSADMVLGTPHNWIQYWALLLYLAHHGGRSVGSFTWLGGDCHVYESHFDMSRKVIETSLKDVVTPNLIYTPSSESFKADDFSLDSTYTPLINEKLEMIV